jgi:hypothetical protein
MVKMKAHSFKWGIKNDEGSLVHFKTLKLFFFEAILYDTHMVLKLAINH